MICTQCGTSNPADALFCIACGAPLTLAPVVEVLEPATGATIRLVPPPPPAAALPAAPTAPATLPTMVGVATSRERWRRRRHIC